MKSSENPDLEFRPPASYTKGREDRVRVIVVHTTEGHEGTTAAEDGAAYDGRRTDGTSCHYFHDADSSVQCVLTTDTAHAARYHGNRIGSHHELCGTAGQGPKGWADPVSQATIRNGARIAARDARKYNIPVRRLTSAEVRGGALGFCGHNEITLAFPEDNGTHWDPGTDFPWAQFLSLVRDELEGKDDVSAAEVWNTDGLIDNPAWRPDAKTNLKITGRTAIGVAMEEAHAARVAVTQLAARPVLPPVVLTEADRVGIAALVVAELQRYELGWRVAS